MAPSLSQLCDRWEWLRTESFQDHDEPSRVGLQNILGIPRCDPGQRTRIVLTSSLNAFATRIER
jgi:hypothetical protein